MEAMDLKGTVNKTLEPTENVSLSNDGPGDLQDSDRTIIICISSAAAIMLVALGIMAWRYLSKTRHGFTRRHVLLRESMRPVVPRSSLPSKEFRRLLRVYSNVGKDEPDNNITKSPKNNFDPGGAICCPENSSQSPVKHSPHNSRRSPYRIPPRTRLSKSDVSISPHVLSRSKRKLLSSSSMDTPEIFRKSSGSTHSTPYSKSPLIASSTPVNQMRSDSLISDDSIFSSPLGQYRFQKFMRMGARPKKSSIPTPPTATVSMDACSTSKAEPPENKPFYFSWPVEEEEDNAAMFSPLLMKLATLDRPKNGKSHKKDVTAEPKNPEFFKERLAEQEQIAVSHQIQNPSRKIGRFRESERNHHAIKRKQVKMLPKSEIDRFMRARRKKTTRMDVSRTAVDANFTIQQPRDRKDKLQPLHRKQVEAASELEISKLLQHQGEANKIMSSESFQRQQQKELRAKKGIVGSMNAITVPDGMKSTWV